MTITRVSAVSLVLCLLAPLHAQVPVPQGQGRDVSRDTGQAAAPATGMIAGKVTMAGTGQPVYGVRVTLTGAEIRGSRSVMTDDEGQYVFPALPAGTFTVRGSLTGHISGTFGQKQPGRAGTSIALAEGQQLKEASFEIAKGGVITGAVFDDRNRPSVGTPVRVMRWMMQSGERVLTTAGTATTDDRGIYRVYNLQPGNYIVSAVPRNTPMEVITSELVEREQMTAMLAAGYNVSVDISQARPTQAASEPVQGYAPVFYPGTTQIQTARELRVGISEEQTAIDFQLSRVPLTRITGQVIAPQGVSPTSVQVRLISIDSYALGANQQSARPNASGVFTFQQVVPGQYTLFAFANISNSAAANAARQQELTRQLQMLQANQGPIPAPPPPPPGASQQRVWAQADVFVDGSFPPAVTLSLQDGLSISGQLAFVGASAPPASARLRVTMSPLGPAQASMGVGSMTATADERGNFTVAGIVPGRYRINANSAQGWQLKSALAGGVDVLDFPLDVVPGTPLPPLTLQFGDRHTMLTGVMTGPDGAPSSEYSVVIFPEDQRYWVPYARRMRSTRPSTDGKFSFGSLPAGDYRLAAVTDLDAGEILDPEFLRQLLPASVSVRLVDGQPATQDIRVR